jgi:glutaredoxin
MHLYKAKDDECSPCAKLSQYIKDNSVQVDTTVITFESLRRGDFPFKVVPSLVLDDGSVISGFAPIRLKLSQKEK